MSLPRNIAVMYIARGDVGGAQRMSAFAEAYLRFPAERAHDLLFLAKGDHSAADFAELLRVAQSCRAEVIRLSDDGFDWAAYFRTAAQIPHRWICALNSHTRPCVPGWLRLLSAPAGTPAFGVVGATGSWEAQGLWPAAMTALQRIRVGAKRALAVLRRQPLTAFPNAHVRSTGFLIGRDLFLEFAANSRPPRTKAQAHRLESGHHGLSNFVLRERRSLLVAGADGRLYAAAEWPRSGTFRAQGQHNLILRDNRTDQYDRADPTLRTRLEMLAWGPPPTMPPSGRSQSR